MDDFKVFFCIDNYNNYNKIPPLAEYFVRAPIFSKYKIACKSG